MEPKTWLEWLISALAGNVVSGYLINLATNIFPGLERFLMPSKAWITGGKVLYAGGYQDVRDPDYIVFLRRGGEFPPSTDGNDTSWQMTTWDAGEAEEAAKGCQESIGVFAVILLIALVFVLWFRWLASMVPNGTP